jgi:hypothetical protein
VNQSLLLVEADGVYAQSCTLRNLTNLHVRLFSRFSIDSGVYSNVKRRDDRAVERAWAREFEAEGLLAELSLDNYLFYQRIRYCLSL